MNTGTENKYRKQTKRIQAQKTNIGNKLHKVKMSQTAQLTATLLSLALQCCRPQLPISNSRINFHQITRFQHCLHLQLIHHPSTTVRSQHNNRPRQPHWNRLQLLQRRNSERGNKLNNHGSRTETGCSHYIGATTKRVNSKINKQKPFKPKKVQVFLQSRYPPNQRR